MGRVGFEPTRSCSCRQESNLLFSLPVGKKRKIPAPSSERARILLSHTGPGKKPISPKARGVGGMPLLPVGGVPRAPLCEGGWKWPPVLPRGEPLPRLLVRGGVHAPVYKGVPSCPFAGGGFRPPPRRGLVSHLPNPGKGWIRAYTYLCVQTRI